QTRRQFVHPRAGSVPLRRHSGQRRPLARHLTVELRGPPLPPRRRLHGLGPGSVPLSISTLRPRHSLTALTLRRRSPRPRLLRPSVRVRPRRNLRRSRRHRRTGLRLSLRTHLLRPAPPPPPQPARSKP